MYLQEVDADSFVRSVVLETGKTVTSVSAIAGSRFSVKVEKRTVGYVEYAEANYLMIASGSSAQVHKVSVVLAHSSFHFAPFLTILTCVRTVSGIQTCFTTWSLYCETCTQFIHFQD